MRIVALLTVRNEEVYLHRCLTHLYEQGIEVCLIDNGSTDRSLEIAASFRDKNVLRIENLPYRGAFELKTILKNEERLARQLQADWYIHHDADEIRHAQPADQTLAEGILEADRLGYNAVNFEEFVFIPFDKGQHYEGMDYVKAMRHYYYFAPSPLRRLNAWKNLGQPINISDCGGHIVAFEGRRISPVNFILRHYIILSWDHAVRKYSNLQLGQEEVALGWFAYRQGLNPKDIVLPKRHELKEITESGEWDRSDPWEKHSFLEGKGSKRFGTTKRRS